MHGACLAEVEDVHPSVASSFRPHTVGVSPRRGVLPLLEGVEESDETIFPNKGEGSTTQ